MNYLASIGLLLLTMASFAVVVFTVFGLLYWVDKTVQG